MAVRLPEVAPSILSADFAHLADDIRKVESLCGRIHVDVMDGHFVPNLSMGPGVVRSIRPVTQLPLEVHLMVEEPEKFVEPFLDSGADRLIFHIEVVSDPVSLSEIIRNAGASPGLALNPETPWDVADKLADEFDLVLLMTVHPGFGGQDFLGNVLPKVEQAYHFLTESDRLVDIEVDGGITPETARSARLAGANVFVAGHSIFRSEDPADACRALREAVGLEG